MNNQQLKQYYTGYSECWKLFRKYATAGGSDSQQYWDCLVREAGDLYNRFSENDFVKNMIKETVYEIERISKHGTEEDPEAAEDLQNLRP